MKVIAILIIALGSFELNAKTAGIRRLKMNKEVQKLKPKERMDNHDELLAKILENNKKLNQLLKTRSTLPVIWEQGAKIFTGKVFRGVLLNSINSTNLGSPVLVSAMPGQGLPLKTKFSCSGVTLHNRVFTLCNKMVTADKEIQIQAQILNIDGTSGLLGQFDDGKEDLIAGAVISDFAQGILSAAQSRVSGPFGAVRDDSVKNQVLQGGIESGRTTSGILLEEMKTKEPIVSVNAGEEVLIYFMEAINEN